MMELIYWEEEVGAALGINPRPLATNDATFSGSFTYALSHPIFACGAAPTTMCLITSRLP
jgi:hypothetical protein